MAQFGVAEAQVRRDHAISHVLAALSSEHCDDVIFFGGTALSRTYLHDARLSEDIDLIALGDRDDLAVQITSSIENALRRTHGRIAWSPGFSTNTDIEPAILTTADGVAIKLQLLRREGYASWPTSRHAVEQRYADAPPATLITPTLAAFAGWKTATWMDRHSPRDLYDLWAMSNVGALDAQAADLFTMYGPTGSAPRRWMFDHAPNEVDWQVQLGGQTRLIATAQQALDVVRAAWSAALEEDWST